MASSFSRAFTPEPYNESLKSYAPGTEERQRVKEACENLRNGSPLDVPCVVNGKEIRSGDVKKQLMPSSHKVAACTFHQANKDIVKQAIEGALAAKEKWEAMPFEQRAAIFLQAADLIATKYRYEMNASTMLGQGKTVGQAEIDAVAEVVDFLRFNVKYAEQIYGMQPPKNSPGVWNRVEYRPLEGYVVAISPFNFTAIGTNLPTSVAIMGNVVLWKPASTAVLSNYVFYRVLLECGLPPGVIQFIPGSGAMIGELVFNHRSFAGLHFTGSTSVFNDILVRTTANLQRGLYLSYPRICGETGGKDFHFVHSSANVRNVVNQTIRAAFEYQGQKCSACSRCYMPSTLWPEISAAMKQALAQLRMGQPDDFGAFMSAVIDRNAFESITRYIDVAKNDPQHCTIISGADASEGYFIRPCIIQVSDPKHRLMCEEIFGPVLTVFVYDADKYEETLRLCDSTSPFALTGSLFATDREALTLGSQLLRNAAGNFYINDKCTGAVVGQQPFGGARASGTNDKAGSVLNLFRWTSARTIKESFAPPLDSWAYPHMDAAVSNDKKEQ